MEKFVAAAGRIKVGNPSDPDTGMGPVASQAQQNSIEYYIKTGIDEGATLVFGGTRPETSELANGYYILPTVFTGCTPEMTISREEVFGPVVGFFKFTSDDEVLEAGQRQRFWIMCFSMDQGLC